MVLNVFGFGGEFFGFFFPSVFLPYTNKGKEVLLQYTAM